MSRFGGSRRASDLCAGLLLELWADLLAAAPSSEPVLEEEGRRAEGGRGGEGRKEAQPRQGEIERREEESQVREKRGVGLGMGRSGTGSGSGSGLGSWSGLESGVGP